MPLNKPNPSPENSELKPSALSMRVAIFNAMALSLWRDRAAFALTFMLPPVIFAIFAAVFSTAASGDISIRLGVTAPNDEISQEVATGLKTSDLVSNLQEYSNSETLILSLEYGDIDAGIEILRPDETAPPTFNIYYNPIKKSAATLAEAALAAQRPQEDEDDSEELTSVEPARYISITGDEREISMAAYYVAGVGMLFIFLSGFQSALSVIEERDSGVMERIAAGPYGIRPMIDGKFAFLIVQGCMQFLIIIIVAMLFFNVTLLGNPMILLISVFAASVCVGGIALGVVGCCKSRSQAHALGAILALIMAALGGSMAPRFLMSAYVRDIGAFTPNAWGIEALSFSFWRDGNATDALLSWGLLFGSGLAGLVIAWTVMQRTLRQ